jgi:hypothetical protein
MKIFLVLCLCLPLSGCIALMEEAYEQQQANQTSREWAAKVASVREVPVLVVSEPPGAIIEMNNEALCTTPCTISLKALPDGTLFMGQTVDAIPTQAGDFTQSKLFVGGNPVPKLILFNMHLRPVFRR